MSNKNFDKQLLLECLNKVGGKLSDIIIGYVKTNELSLDEKAFLCQILVRYIKISSKEISNIRSSLKELFHQLEQDDIEYNQ